MEKEKEIEIIIEKEIGKIYDKIFSAVAQLDSYNALLLAYIDQNEHIPEMLHLNLLSDKVQEQINILKNFAKVD